MALKDKVARALASKIKISQFDATNMATTGQVPSSNPDGSITWVENGGAGSDSKDLKVSSTDTTSAFLQDKLIGTTNKIILSKTNNGANEKLNINIGNDIL